jgi:Predicted membrane protein
VAYSSVRFTEAWGLWKRRVWAEWFALLSGALYLPWEIVKVAERPNLVHLTVFITNMIVLLYMLYIRVAATRYEVKEEVAS